MQFQTMKPMTIEIKYCSVLNELLYQPPLRCQMMHIESRSQSGVFPQTAAFLRSI